MGGGGRGHGMGVSSTGNYAEYRLGWFQIESFVAQFVFFRGGGSMSKCNVLAIIISTI